MSRLAFCSDIINRGYVEIEREESPVDIGTDVYYYRKGKLFATVDKDGRYVMWIHPDEDEEVRLLFRHMLG